MGSQGSGTHQMKISVALCTYNGERFLSEQLESYLDQNRLPDELVVCDDGSSDSTISILKAFRQQAPFPVSVHINDTNLGLVANFGKVISLCTGDAICLSDQDDVWLPNKLELVEKAFYTSDNVGMVYADADVVTERLQSTGLTMWNCIRFNPSKKASFKAGMAFDELLKDGTVLGSSMAFLSKFNSLILPIPQDIYFVHDNWIALVVAAVSDVQIIEKPLIKYRQHSDQTSSGMQPPNVTSVNSVLTSTKTKNDFTASITQLDILRNRLAGNERCTASINKLTAARNHFMIRSRLPQKFSGRIYTVIKEYFNGNYGKYSNGFLSAIKDVFIQQKP